ncbi:MAG: hypothetical protein ACK5I7_01605 [Anaerotignum sp.]
MKFYKNSIVSKMVLSIAIPAFVMFVVLVVVIVSSVKQSISTLSDEVITRNSVSASLQISQYFEEEMALVKSKSVNTQLSQFVKN